MKSIFVVFVVIVIVGLFAVGKSSVILQGQKLRHQKWFAKAIKIAKNNYVKHSMELIIPRAK
jgi:hypothetical protein